jgi:hypothetical protein
VNWSAVDSSQNGGSDITGYDVEYSTSKDSGWVPAPGSPYAASATSANVAGLNNGTPYYFEVAAVNGVGAGSYAVTSSAVTPSAPAAAQDATSITVSPAAVTVDYGKSTSLKATLWDDVTTDSLSAALTLQSGSTMNGPWTTVTSSSSGTAKVSPSKTTYYRWSYAGDSTHGASTSAVVQVSVSRLVSIAASPTTFKHGKSTTIYGTISPIAGGTVTLQEQVGKKWVKVGAASIKKQKLPNRKTAVGYVITFKTSKKGNYTLEVVVSTTSGYATVTSGVVKVRVS